MKYMYGKQTKERRWPFRIAMGVLVIVIALIVGTGIYVLGDLKHNDDEVATLSKTSAVAGATTARIETAYFRFIADSGWNFVPRDSNPKKFTYHHQKSGLVDQELVIYIDDQIPTIPKTAFALPITILDGKKIAQDDVSIPCKNKVPDRANKNPQLVHYDDLTYWCTPDDTQYSILVVRHGGDHNLPFYHIGKPLSYAITYRDLRFTMDTKDITKLLSTFESL